MPMKCECYHTIERIKQIPNPLTGGTMRQKVDVGVCWGTREKDECTCGGDKSKCDFYPKEEEPKPFPKDNSALKEALNVIEDGMCRVATTRDIWQNDLIYALCYAVRLLLIREIKRK